MTTERKFSPSYDCLDVGDCESAPTPFQSYTESLLHLVLGCPAQDPDCCALSRTKGLAVS